jgi:predicted hotdog family 3-hydroxylacyl-ACP dehydratase
VTHDRHDRRDRAWIAAHIPHQGTMCLLDRVDEWDAQRIRCTATSHRDAANPLRAHGRLGAACGIEYAAQAMAVHGALTTAQAVPRSGYLASVRNAALHVGRLDDVDADLAVEAQRLSGDDNTVLYDFTVRAGERVLLEGRAAVIMDAGAIKPNQ